MADEYDPHDGAAHDGYDHDGGHVAGDDGGAGGGAGGGAEPRGRWGYGGADAGDPEDMDAILNGGGDEGKGDDDAYGYGAGGAGDAAEGEDAYDDDDGAGEDVDLEHELPAFANAANRELNEVIKDTEKRLMRERAAAKENRERVAVMTEHLKNVKQELAHTQRLLEAKTKEVHTEDHLKQLAEREVGACGVPAQRVPPAPPAVCATQGSASSVVGGC
jgi:hypothetical protein